MQIKVNYDESCQELQVNLVAPSNSVELQQVLVALNSLQQQTEQLIAYADNQLVLVDLAQIKRSFISDKQVWVQTAKGSWKLRQSISSLANSLPQNFIRISQSEIVNRHFIDRLDLSYDGTIKLYLHDGSYSFVSGRSIKNFKQALGL